MTGKRRADSMRNWQAKGRELVVSARFVGLGNFLVLGHFGGSNSELRELSIGLAASLPMKKGVFFKMIFSGNTSLMVRERGLEPLCPKTPEPKSGASANSATRAQASFDYRKFLWKTQAALFEPSHFSKRQKSLFLCRTYAGKSRLLPGRCVLCAG